MPGHLPSTVLDAVIAAELQDWNDVKTLSFAMTPAQAALLIENPGLINDPVLGAGAASLAALNLNWSFFFSANFETTGMSKILTVQQSLDRQRAVGFVMRLRTSNGGEPAFNLNQIA